MVLRTPLACDRKKKMDVENSVTCYSEEVEVTAEGMKVSCRCLLTLHSSRSPQF